MERRWNRSGSRYNIGADVAMWQNGKWITVSSHCGGVEIKTREHGSTTAELSHMLATCDDRSTSSIVEIMKGRESPSQVYCVSQGPRMRRT
jgi:hypothetical protein